MLIFFHLPYADLYRVNPKWVVYNSLVSTDKHYMRNVIAIDPSWLMEAAPHFYQQRTPNPALFWLPTIIMVSVSYFVLEIAIHRSLKDYASIFHTKSFEDSRHLKLEKELFHWLQKNHAFKVLYLLYSGCRLLLGFITFVKFLIRDNESFSLADDVRFFFLENNRGTAL